MVKKEGKEEKKSQEEGKSTEKEAQKDQKDEEPSLVHYLIILVILVAVIALVYYGIVFFTGGNDSSVNFYPYKHEVGNVTYNIQFRYPVSDLEDNLDKVPPVRSKFLNSIEGTLAYRNYSKADNAKVTVASVQLGRFLRKVMFLDVNTNTTDKMNCTNSSDSNLVMTFNPYSSKNDVYWDDDHPFCLRINATSADNLILMSNSVMYKATQE